MDMDARILVLLMEEKRRMSRDEIERRLTGKYRQDIRLALNRLVEEGRVKPVGNGLEMVQ